MCNLPPRDARTIREDLESILSYSPEDIAEMPEDEIDAILEEEGIDMTETLAEVHELLDKHFGKKR